jgi:cysteine desulfurase
MSRRIYMDHHATTPTDPRVVEAMRPWWTECPGNPSSPHVFGWEAQEAVQGARSEVARLLGAEPKEIVFSAGATESNNLAILGAMDMYRDRGRHFVTTNIEHPSVLQAAAELIRRGTEVSIVEVEPDGRVDPTKVAAALRPDTVLCSVMWANNEVGTIQPMCEIAESCRARGVLLHSDATQAIGRIPVDARRGGVDLLSLSAHKFYGPKGIGALVVRRRRPRVRLSPVLWGGGQQEGLRPGTLPVPLIVGLGEACALARELLPDEAPRLLALRERLHGHFAQALDGVLLNGHPEERLPGNLSLSFLGVEAQAILLELPGIGLSVGSACSAEANEPSEVLLAIGRRAEEAHATLRFGLGRSNTEAEVDEVAAAVIEAVQRLRRRSPVHHATDGRAR